MTLTLIHFYSDRLSSDSTANASTLQASTPDASLLRKGSIGVIELACCVVDLGL